MSVTESVKSARRVSVPILAINTPDQAATVATLVAGVNGNTPKVQWDFVRGFKPLNDEGAEAILVMTLLPKERDGDPDEFSDPSEFAANPTAAIGVATKLPGGTIVFIQNAHRYLDDAGVCQAIANLRDAFKQDVGGGSRMLILLGPSITLPVELAGDVIVVDEPLPSPADIERIILDVHEAAGIEVVPETLAKAVSATTGLPAFQVEQITAMSLTPDGIVLSDLWERKRQQIEMTPGLSVYRDGETFDSVGGCQSVKDFLARVFAGRNAPNAIVKIDEIDKAMAGEGDLSGISQDQLGTLLTYMEDHGVRGLLFVGPPGCSKSLVSKAAGNEAGVPTIEFDMGAMKGGIVGQSEQQFRAALKVVTSVSNDRPLFIATCNSIDKLNTAMLRRFPKTFYFDLPDLDERRKIWDIHRERCGLAETTMPSDEGWAGSDIRNCCEDARDLDCSVEDAARWVVPVGVRSRGEIDKLRKQANGVLLSASYEGVYRMAEAKGRKMDV